MSRAVRRGMGLEVIGVGHPDTVLVLTAACPECGERTEMRVRADGFWAWQDNVFIQDALPELTPTDRELLLNGTHATCFETLFGEDGTRRT